MKKYFFNSIIESILYLIFLSIIPLVSIIIQFISSDKTLYVSIFVSAFSMSYDYIALLSRKICKRLWYESIVSIICLVLASVLSIIRLLVLIINNTACTSYKWDIILIFILAIIMFINVIEFSILVKYDHKKRYSSESDVNLNNFNEGASNV